MTSTRTEIDAVLEAAVEDGHVHGIVATAANRDGTIYEGAAGVRVAGGDDPMAPDTVFRIASMTKMVTTVAALQLSERGELDLGAPVDELIPEFAGLRVLEGFDGDTPRLREPTARATVRHLVTHTSGLTHSCWNAGLGRWQEATGTPDITSGVMKAFTAPLVADPGTAFLYGISTDWLGRVVEAVSGETLDAYWQVNIFDRLAMDDTTVRMDAEQRSRSTPVHRRDDRGQLVPTDLDLAQDPEFWGGGRCLYSTPRDYLRFQEMLLGGGALGGTRILAEETVDEIFRHQIGDVDLPAELRSARPDASADLALGPGATWGYGLLLNTEQRPGMRAPYSGGWAGLHNTYYWVDRRTGVTGAVYAQSLPFAEPRVLGVYEDFERALYASL